ncbi:hypothetical protein NWE60_03105 [Mycoplasmopsis felis]|nr:hypothetical protein [Mycoplasmopsis felis]WAM01556.1 hypothetical protein NWE60_03105 [Mycoplasmopsis felis]
MTCLSNSFIFELSEYSKNSVFRFCELLISILITTEFVFTLLILISFNEKLLLLGSPHAIAITGINGKILLLLILKEIFF